MLCYIMQYHLCGMRYGDWGDMFWGLFKSIFVFLQDDESGEIQEKVQVKTAQHLGPPWLAR